MSVPVKKLQSELVDLKKKKAASNEKIDAKIIGTARQIAERAIKTMPKNLKKNLTEDVFIVDILSSLQRKFECKGKQLSVDLLEKLFVESLGFFNITLAGPAFSRKGTMQDIRWSEDALMKFTNKLCAHLNKFDFTVIINDDSHGYDCFSSPTGVEFIFGPDAGFARQKEKARAKSAV